MPDPLQDTTAPDGSDHLVLSPRSSALRLSARARAVLSIAHELARREPGFEPHSGHVLIALLRAGGAVIDDTFEDLGVGYEAALAAVARSGPAPDPTREMADLLAAGERVVVESGQVYLDAA